MFDGFRTDRVRTSGAELHVVHGGSGPPLLLLHGHPRTHATWHAVAPRLARHFTVVCPDLRGFGRSSIPPDTPRNAHSAKREKARDCIELMAALGHDRFGLAGHDRGAYTAFRCAMDHPDRVTALAVLDAVPIAEALERCGETFARAWWHWFFYAVPGKPERAILQNPDAWYPLSPERVGDPEAYRDIRRALHDPAVIHGMMEDYRAGLGLDREHDLADRASGRKLACPTLVLWALGDDLPILYGDVLAVWRPWATQLRGDGFPSGHHMAEEEPRLLAEALQPFFAAHL